MTPLRILVVEDEVLIAETIKHFLENSGYRYECVGIAISYEEATKLYDDLKPDIVLLDVRLYGNKSGIDVAKYITNQENPVPFIFLTSQYDKNIVEKALETIPAGYLTKPINNDTLLTTVALAHTTKHIKTTNDAPSINIKGVLENHVIKESDITYIESSHVYINIHTKEKKIVSRMTLSRFFDSLASDKFHQCHRQFVVNLDQIISWNKEYIKLTERTIPISRSRRKTFVELMKAHYS